MREPERRITQNLKSTSTAVARLPWSLFSKIKSGVRFRFNKFVSGQFYIAKNQVNVYLEHIRNPENEIYVSVVSYWEIPLKYVMDKFEGYLSESASPDRIALHQRIGSITRFTSQEPKLRPLAGADPCGPTAPSDGSGFLPGLRQPSWEVIRYNDPGMPVSSGKLRQSGDVIFMVPAYELGPKPFPSLM